MKTKTLSTALAIALSLGMSPLLAADKPLSQEVKEARLEGQIATAILFNPHLNPFEIDVDVEGDTAILSGTVDEDIDRELAARVALNAEGIARVDNRIRVDAAAEPRSRSGERSFGDRVSDATTSAQVKSRLLWNRATSGLDIKVETVDGEVTLQGEVGSAAEKELAERIARDTRGVHGVNNRLSVAGEGSGGARAVAREVGDALSDTWITARVKSSLLYSRNVDGLDFSVETRDGVVYLSGSADSRAERDLAVEIAKDIRGVSRVDASAVKIGA
jgi:osmotically-inducible protein OsmY